MSIILLLTFLVQCCIIVYMARCPNCNQKVESTAVVAAFNDPPDWAFWGVEGCRWIVCRGAGYVHFRVQIDGRMYHRLAQITKAAQVPTPTRPVEKPLPALPLFEQPQEDWLP